MASRFELPPRLHTQPCALHQGPPFFPGKDSLPSGTCPSSAQEQHSTARDGTGTERGLRDAVSHPRRGL